MLAPTSMWNWLIALGSAAIALSITGGVAYLLHRASKEVNERALRLVVRLVSLAFAAMAIYVGLQFFLLIWLFIREELVY